MVEVTVTSYKEKQINMSPFYLHQMCEKAKIDIRFQSYESKFDRLLIVRIESILQILSKKYWLFKIPSLVMIGSIVGEVTLNPIALGITSGSYLILKTYSKAKGK